MENTNTEHSQNPKCSFSVMEIFHLVCNGIFRSGKFHICQTTYFGVFESPCATTSSEVLKTFNGNMKTYTIGFRPN